LIEGRKPNFFVAKSLAQQTGQKARYSKNLAFDKQYYLDLICKAVKEHGSMARKDIDELLWNKLPDWMSESSAKPRWATCSASFGDTAGSSTEAVCPSLVDSL
jgi:ATP-dependent DNA helicase RecG